jgi:hypothetical protein
MNPNMYRGGQLDSVGQQARRRMNPSSRGYQVLCEVADRQVSNPVGKSWLATRAARP